MAPDTSDIDVRTVWVGNLDGRVSEELLWELFLQAGPLESVRIPKDYKTGKLRNFAFVVFQHKESVPYVMGLMNQIKLYDSPLRICLKNKPSNENASNEHDQMRQVEQQDRYDAHSPLLQQPHQPSWHAMPLGLMSQPVSHVPFAYAEDIRYLHNMPEWGWEETRMAHRRREEHLMHRSYSYPHQLHEESRRPHPYHHGRRHR